jgi:hypothetical protein
LYRRVCDKSPIFSQRLYRGIFSHPNLEKIVSDGGGGLRISQADFLLELAIYRGRHHATVGYWKDAFHDVRLFSLIKAERSIYPTA